MVEDPQQIKAAAGAFGMLGVVTHITYVFDAMTYAVMVRLLHFVAEQLAN
jgi:hypothetical protein